MSGMAPIHSLGDGASQTLGVIWFRRFSVYSVSYLTKLKDKMVQCAVRGCTSRTDTVGVSSRMQNAVHFHRVPKDPGIKKKWCQAIQRKEIKESTRVCSVHFRKDNYYSTKQGLQKLAVGSVPELKLGTTSYNDFSGDEAMSNAQPPKEGVAYKNQFQQKSSKDQPLENETADNAPSLDLQPKENKEDEESTSSEDEKMSEVETQDENIHLDTNFQQNWEEKSIDSVSESSIKPGVRKYKVRTPLEKRLLKEVERLKQQGKQKMEAIHCLLEQNKRLLKRNSFLEKALQDSKKVAEIANRVAQQETNFFMSAAVNSNVSITIND